MTARVLSAEVGAIFDGLEGDYDKVFPPEEGIPTLEVMVERLGVEFSDKVKDFLIKADAGAKNIESMWQVKEGNKEDFAKWLGNEDAARELGYTLLAQISAFQWIDSDMSSYDPKFKEGEETMSAEQETYLELSRVLSYMRSEMIELLNSKRYAEGVDTVVDYYDLLKMKLFLASRLGGKSGNPQN